MESFKDTVNGILGDFATAQKEFGLYTDWGGKSELSMIVIKPGDYYSTEDALERYHAIKSKWGIE